MLLPQSLRHEASMVFYGGASYEALSTLAFILTLAGIRRVWNKEESKAETLISVLVVGLFFGVAWEPEGIGLVWSYRGFRIHAFMGIPIAILLSWAWWMVVCYLLSERLARLFDRAWGRRGRRLTSTAAFFASGLLASLVIEPISVYLGWWEYLVVGEKAALVFPLLGVSFSQAVIVGWGMLTALNLTLSEVAGHLAARFRGRLNLGRIPALVLWSAPLGVYSGWFSWQLVALFAALIEDESPRLFFTREHIIVLEGVTGVQITALLIFTSIFSAYLMKKANRPRGGEEK